MSTIKQEYNELVKNLETQRDEINVQMHLAKAELRDEWQGIEKKWQHFKAKSDRVLKQADSSAEEIGETLHELGQELKQGYKRIKDLL